MSLPQALSTALEIGINRALDWSFNKDELLSPLVDKTCIIFVQEIEKALIFSFDANQISVSIDENGEYNHNPDELDNTALDAHECWVSVSLFAIEQLKQNSQLTKLIKSGQLDFAGNLSILQALSKLYERIDLDGEEILSKYLGDVLAHNVHSVGKDISQTLFQQLTLLQYTISDLALDEKPIAVRGIMVTNFCDEVADLQSGVDRIEAKVDILEAKLKENKKIKTLTNKTSPGSMNDRTDNNKP